MSTSNARPTACRTNREFGPNLPPTAARLQSFLVDLTDDLHYGILLASDSLEILWMNRLASVMLRRGDGLRLDRNQLVATTPQTTKRIRGLLEAPRNAARSVCHVVKIPRRAVLPLALFIKPLRSHAEDGPAASYFCSAMLIFDPERVIPADPNLLAKIYGLTESESRVARLLMQGNTLHQISTLLRKKRETARKQLQSIFQKTNTRRQADLIRLLLSGPATLGRFCESGHSGDPPDKKSFHPRSSCESPAKSCLL